MRPAAALARPALPVRLLTAQPPSAPSTAIRAGTPMDGTGAVP